MLTIQSSITQSIPISQSLLYNQEYLKYKLINMKFRRAFSEKKTIHANKYEASMK